MDKIGVGIQKVTWDDIDVSTMSAMSAPEGDVVEVWVCVTEFLYGMDQILYLYRCVPVTQMSTWMLVCLAASV